MDDLDKFLKVVFQVAEDARQLKPPYNPLDYFTLAEDLEGQKQDIRWLVTIAHMEAVQSRPVPYELRKVAFDKLRELAKHYRNADPESVPVEMYLWALGVASGDIKQPMRPHRRPRAAETLTYRDQVMGTMFLWLQEQGVTESDAIKRLHNATELTTDYIKDILQKNPKE